MKEPKWETLSSDKKVQELLKTMWNLETRIRKLDEKALINLELYKLSQ